MADSANRAVDLDSLFHQFTEDKRYLSSVTSSTVRSYQKSYRAFTYQIGCCCSITLDPKFLRVVASRLAQAHTPGSYNSYARSINSFLSWLFELGHTSDHLKLPKIKQQREPLATYTEQQMNALIRTKPQTMTERRVHLAICLMADTGLRVSEALGLRWSDIDLDNLIVRVKGKGQKVRIVPISLPMRALLFRAYQSHPQRKTQPGPRIAQETASQERHIFSVRCGSPIGYHNLKRDFLRWLGRCGVPKSFGSFHALRRFCARRFLKNGGSIRYLQILLGHASITTTTIYLDHDTEGLSTEVRRVGSVLDR